MKQVVITIVLIVLFGFGLFWAGSTRLDSEFRATSQQIATQRELAELAVVERQLELEIERMEFLHPVQKWTGAVARIAGTFLVIMLALIAVDIYWQRRSPLVSPDKRGMLPVPRLQITSGELTQLNNQLLVMRQNVLALKASHAPAPHTLHYKPVGQTTGTLPEPLTQPQFRLPEGKLNLEDYLPNSVTLDAITLSVLSNGDPVRTKATRLCHVGIAGATGNGKTVVARYIIAQLLMAGAMMVHCDPHYANVDPKSGEDWRPIRQRLYMPPAYKISDIEEMFKWVLGEMKKRLAQRRAGQMWDAPLFLSIDELPAIIAKLPDTMDYLGEILREGRKVDILLITATQDMLVKTLGSAGAVRECFRTGIYVGGDPTTARLLLDIKGKVDDGHLGKGVAMMRSSATPIATEVRLPYMSNEALYRLLPTSNPTSAPLPAHFQNTPAPLPKATSTPVEVGNSPKIERIRAMLRNGDSQNVIIQEIWGATGGRKYQQASAELSAMIAEMV